MTNPEVLVPLSHHLDDLRTMLLRILSVVAVGFVVAFLFHQPVIAFLTAPFEGKLAIFGPTEGFTTVIKMCFWMALVGSSPLWLFFVVRFVMPALHLGEKRLLLPFLALSLLFLGGGLAFAYLVTIPLANTYLFAFNEGLGVNVWGLSQYLDYTVILMLANGLAFESMVILVFMVHYGYVTPEGLARKRKHAVITALIISAILTPPDVVTQLLMALPLCVLYEVAIWYGRLVTGRSSRSASQFPFYPSL